MISCGLTLITGLARTYGQEQGMYGPDTVTATGCT